MAGPYPQIVLLGDSLFQQCVDLQEGYSMQAALQSRYIRRFDVVNRGFSGWNTKNILNYLDDIFPEVSSTSARIKYLAILLGANDASLPVETNRQHVPIDHFTENLQKIINHPRIKAHDPKILLVTPPPVDQIKLEKSDTAEGHAGAIRTSAVSASYSQRVRETAQENAARVTLIELWQAIMDKAISMTPNDFTAGGPWLGSPENGRAGGLDTLLPDGLHMNGEAYHILFDLLVPHIDEAPEEVVDREQYVFPEWRVLSPPNLPAHQ